MEKEPKMQMIKHKEGKGFTKFSWGEEKYKKNFSLIDPHCNTVGSFMIKARLKDHR